MNAQVKKEGFTIIEVVLVLAIAGLIFLMVFIALPALQRGQRDTARKSDVSTVSSAVSDYTGNNRGLYPTKAQLTDYVTDVSDNTDTTKLDVVAFAAEVPVEDGKIVVVKGARCAATGKATDGIAKQTLTAGTKRQYATVSYLEAGGGTSYCLEG